MDVFAHVDSVYVAAAMCATLIEHPATPVDAEPALLLRCGYPARAIDQHISVARRARDELMRKATR